MSISRINSKLHDTSKHMGWTEAFQYGWDVTLYPAPYQSVQKAIESIAKFAWQDGMRPTIHPSPAVEALLIFEAIRMV